MNKSTSQRYRGDYREKESKMPGLISGMVVAAEEPGI